MFSRQSTKRFSATVPPGETRVLTSTIQEPATVEQVNIRFYQGPELDLLVDPFRQRQNDRMTLVETNGRESIVGDADRFVFHVSEQLHADDEIGVRVENTSTEYEYDFQTDMIIEYAGGVSRALSSLTGVL
jgi:hypothetical protein